LQCGPFIGAENFVNQHASVMAVAAKIVKRLLQCQVTMRQRG